MKQAFINSLPRQLLITGHYESQIVTVGGSQLLPDESLNVVNHSPDGFAWGYGGSGPAQLALAILLKYMPKENALRYYQAFKFNVIASLPQSNFSVRINLQEEIEDIVKVI